MTKNMRHLTTQKSDICNFGANGPMLPLSFTPKAHRKRICSSSKRVLILGSGKVDRSVASKILEYGAIPLTFSDASGHVYEPDGIGPANLNVIDKIKNERGALLVRYIIASDTSRFNDPSSVTNILCDLCIPCGSMHDLDADAVNALADNGCQGVIEGGHSTVTAEARRFSRSEDCSTVPIS